MADREQAIADIEQCRQIHVNWAGFQDGDPSWEAKVEPADIGDAEHHREWVRRYDNVLEVLRGDA